jgi:cytochrome c oxidase subunit 2
MQSILSAHGPAAAAIAELAWVLFAGGLAILLLVLVLTACAVILRPAWLAREGFVVATGIAFPVVALSVLLYYVFVVGERLGSHSNPQLRIEVVGEQWWWRVRYPGFETANEVRIPAGKPVELVLRSADVIHSFWVPSLAGKVDMIPGRINRLRLVADKPGVYRGQCAEFCGGPHAKMAFHIVAETPEQFAAWSENQRQPAQKSQPLFLARCAACHTVRGTDARGALGPDLTHIGSRASIGAGTLPNNAGTLAGWIASSQHIKPGNLMPEFREFSAEELKALAAYLESLK